MDIKFKKEIGIIIFVGFLGIILGAGLSLGRKAMEYVWPDKEIVVKHVYVEGTGL